MFLNAAIDTAEPLTQTLKNCWHYVFPDPEKIFCISMQKTGTTSVGKFFRDHGFRWAGWPHSNKNKWGSAYHEGNFERIFSSFDFRIANAFEDSPWWSPEFYKFLYHRFPESRFILFERDADSWYSSMRSHAKAGIIGSMYGHSKQYRRESEYYSIIDRDGDKEREKDPAKELMSLEGMADHYKSIYVIRNREVRDYFSARKSERFFCARLEDPAKWMKLGRYLGIRVSPGYDSHENLSSSATNMPRNI